MYKNLNREVQRVQKPLVAKLHGLPFLRAHKVKVNGFDHHYRTEGAVVHYDDAVANFGDLQSVLSTVRITARLVNDRFCYAWLSRYWGLCTILCWHAKRRRSTVCGRDVASWHWWLVWLRGVHARYLPFYIYHLTIIYQLTFDIYGLHR